MKWYGKIGFGVEENTGYGNWQVNFTERPYYGDLERSYQGFSTSTDSTNTSLSLSNNLSIIADEYALVNFSNIVYAEINGFKWRVSSVEEHYPRLILSIGGAYK